MAEGQSNTPDESPHPPEVSRRDLLKGIAVGAGAYALTRGLHPGDHAIEYLKDTGPVRFILGNHLISPEINTKIFEPYRVTGDLSLSIWNNKSAAIIDKAMQEAKMRGEPYFLMLDSANTGLEEALVVGGGNLDNASRLSVPPIEWPLLPHPNLGRREQYPDKIYLISGDQRDDFGLNGFSQDTIVYRSFLIEDLNKRYRQKSMKEIVQEIKKDIVEALPEKIAEGAIGATLLGAGLSLTSATTRRSTLKVLGLLGGAVGIETTKGLLQGNALSMIIGNLSDPEEQKIATALSSSTEWTIGDECTRLWINARTAIAIEKAKTLSETPPSELNQQPMQIDILYGSMHSANLPRIMADQAYRHTLITEYLKDVLQYIDKHIEGSDVMSPLRNELLRSAAKSILSYKIDKIHMPWDKKTVPPEELSNFARNLTTAKAEGVCHSLESVVAHTLKEFGIKD
jgi:hypothetical protein